MAKIKVKVRERVGKRGQFPLLYMGKTLWVIPNSIVEVDETWLAENGQYFERIKEDVVKEDLKEDTPSADASKPEDKKGKHVPKNSGLAEFLELKKKVVALGVNTNGLKREDLEKILKEHESK